MVLSLSAGDWVRLKRLRGGSRYQSEKQKDITNVVLPTSGVLPFPVQQDVGSSKTRRESSKWIDYVASQRESYILKREASTSLVPRRYVNVINCNCGITPPMLLSARTTGCTKCNIAQHLRM
jgi:hypothetical protein